MTYPNYDNLPWVSTLPFRWQAKATASKTGDLDALFVFRGDEYDMQPANRMTRRCLYLVESLSFLTTIPDDVLAESLNDAVQVTITQKAAGMSPAFPDTLPFVGKCDYLPIRWWFQSNKEPDGLSVSMNAVLRSVEGLLGRETVSFWVVLNGYEVNDQSWIDAFLRNRQIEETLGDSASTDGVSMIQGRPRNTLSQWSP